MEVDTSGYNINNKIDISKVVNDFIEYYFSNITTPEQIIIDGVIKEYTTIKFDNDKYTGDNLLLFLNQFSQNYTNFGIKKINFLESGSRRIDIIIIGDMKNVDFEVSFCQSFVLCNHSDTWFIKNSIFTLI